MERLCEQALKSARSHNSQHSNFSRNRQQSLVQLPSAHNLSLEQATGMSRQKSLVIPPLPIHKIPSSQKQGNPPSHRKTKSQSQQHASARSAQNKPPPPESYRSLR